MLSAIATGKVTGIGNDATHGLYQIIRYGDYEVKAFSYIASEDAEAGNGGEGSGE